MRQIDDPQYLLGLSSQLDEIVGELDDLPAYSESATMGGWLVLHDAHTLTSAAAILKRLSLWAKHPLADSYVTPKKPKSMWESEWSVRLNNDLKRIANRPYISLIREYTGEKS